MTGLSIDGTAFRLFPGEVSDRPLVAPIQAEAGGVFCGLVGHHIWVIRTRTGKKLNKCHFFFKSQRLLRTEKSKNSYTFKSFYLILFSAVLKI